MRQLLFVLALVCGAAAYKKQMLESNRVAEVKESGVKTSCQQCESVIKRLSEAAKDPVKMQELKMILNAMCHETSYVEECRLFVSQIDKFIDKLQPWLKDAHAVCQKIHLCSNKNVESFRQRLFEYALRAETIYYTPQIVCDECEFAVKELKMVIEDKEKQTEVRDFLRNNVCKTLGSYRGFCDLIVDEYLPQFIQQVDAILQNPHQVCVDVHACDTGFEEKARKYNYKSNMDATEEEVEKFWSTAGNEISTKTGSKLEMSCFECKLVVSEAQEEGIKNRKEIAGDIKDFACNYIVPHNMTASCNDFLQLYLPTVLQMTIEQATPAGVCKARKLCGQKSVDAYAELSFHDIQAHKCDNTVAMEKFVSEKLVGSPVEKYMYESMTETICSNLFRFLQPTCDNIVSGLAPRFAATTARLAGKNMFSKQMGC